MTSRLEKNKKQRTDINISVTKEKTKNIGIKVFKILFIIFIVSLTIFIIIRYIGNMGLVVREYPLETNKLPDSFYGVKIVQFSDLNYGSDTVNENKLRKVVKKINSLKPDIVVFTGNLIYKDLNKQELDYLVKQLSSIDAKLGKYEVLGKYDTKEEQIILTNSGFNDLNNDYDLIYNNSSTPIVLIGFNNDIDTYKTFDFQDKDYLKIGIMNNPDLIKEINKNHMLDIALAGYTLNGQIRLPKAGGLFNYNKEYFNEEYDIDGTKLLISGGIGTRNYPYRLFNHPSINLIRLK